MTLDEAIEYYIKVANQRAIADEENGVNDKSKWYETRFMTKKESEQIIADNRQIVEWLKELKEAKRLLSECISRENVLDIASQYCPDDDGSCSKADVDLREMLDEIEALSSAGVQPTEKIKEYQSLLEECERKFRYLLECEIESSSESQKVKGLIVKIQSSLKDGDAE